jgi:hypothetical protein
MARNVSPESAREGLPSLFPVPFERHVETSAMPAPRTSFVGREREVGLVQALLRRDDVRLVTLTGPGGVGKTRTAIRAVSADTHSAQFVDLADVQQPAVVLPTIAAALYDDCPAPYTICVREGGPGGYTTNGICCRFA